MNSNIGRNDPCPCGSGEKYKNCCEGKLALGTRMKASGPWLWIALATGVLIVAAIVLLRPKNPAGAMPGDPAAQAPPAGVAATPWAYDSVTNQHFDPTHNHWHPGRPPAGTSAGAAAGSPPPVTVTPGVATTITPGATAMPGAPTPGAASGQNPAPWTFDAANNQHWDPNHGHWHQGPPPPVGSR